MSMNINKKQEEVLEKTEEMKDVEDNAPLDTPDWMNNMIDRTVQNAQDAADTRKPNPNIVDNTIQKRTDNIRAEAAASQARIKNAYGNRSGQRKAD